MQTEGKKYDYLIKLLLVGDREAGKTKILVRLMEDSWKSSPFIPTIGVDFCVKTVTLPSSGARVKMQIWDTAGQERFQSVTDCYYRGAEGVFLVYDVRREKSATCMMTFYQGLRQRTDQDRVVMVLAHDQGPAQTGSDQPDPAQASSDQPGPVQTGSDQLDLVQTCSDKPDPAQATSNPAQAISCQPDIGVQAFREGRGIFRDLKVDGFQEVSASTGAGIEEAFLMMAELVVAKREARKQGGT